MNVKNEYECLVTQRFQNYKEKKILIYGAGVIAQHLICALSGFKIVGVIDRLRFGGEIAGVQILCWDEIKKGDADIVIIGALQKNYREIYLRIIDKCMTFRMDIYGENGNDLMACYGWNPICIESVKYYRKSKNDLRDLILKYDAVSFDLFDTLVMRKTLEPTDVFDIVEDRLARKGILIPGFKVLRREAELQSGYGDIHTIYKRLGHMAGLTREQERLALEEEIACEKCVLLPRKNMVALLSFAKENGKKVNIISDMYLGAGILDSTLKEMGIQGYEKIYVSCDYGISKGNGLFEMYLRDVSGMKCLHIGDNTEADVNAPHRYGIGAYGIKSALEMAKMSNFRYLLPMANNSNEKCLLGLILSDLFNDPFALYDTSGLVRIGSHELLGKIFAAPLAAFYTIKLAAYLQENPIYQKVIFTARDGFILKKLFDIFKEQKENGQGLPESVYLLASRKLCFRAVVRDWEDLVFLREDKDAGRSAILLEEIMRLGQETLFAHGGKTYEEGLEVVCRNSKGLRRQYETYICDCGLDLSEKYVISDLVSRGTVQFMLNRIFKEPLRGYYLCANESELDVQIEGAYRNDCIRNEGISISDTNFLETIFTSAQPSVDTLDGEGNPIFSKELRSREEIVAMQRTHCGIIAFFSDYCQNLWVNGKEIKKELPHMLLKMRNEVEYVGECKGIKDIKLYDDLGGQYNDIF